MHELAIASEVLDGVLRVAARHGACRVDEVELRVGAMKLVVPEALAAAWEAVAAGTIAEGARLVATELPMKARCRPCGCVFAPAVGDFLCPSCGRADVDIVEGDDIILTSVTCRADEADEADEAGPEGKGP